MHQANFQALHIEATYEAKEVEHLAEAISMLKQYDGFNVTLPHKQSIISYLDEIDELAKQIGAVNTIKRVGEKWVGYNTDADGFYQSFLEFNVPKQAKILIVGAGGAARAVFYALQAHHYETIIVANRTLSRASTLTTRVLTLQEAGEQLENMDVVINTTSVGLAKDECPLDVTTLSAHTIVMDLIYKPTETRLLQEARQRGCPVKNGLEMLLFQGAIAFEYWFSKTADKLEMKRILEEELDVKW